MTSEAERPDGENSFRFPEASVLPHAPAKPEEAGEGFAPEPLPVNS